MIQSKLFVGDKVITSDEFPEAAVLRTVSEDGIVTTYCDNEYLSTRLTENQVGRYLLLEQNALAHEPCDLEIHRTGLPVLMMSIAKEANIVRSRGTTDRHWRTGDGIQD